MGNEVNDYTAIEMTTFTLHMALQINYSVHDAIVL